MNSAAFLCVILASLSHVWCYGDNRGGGHGGYGGYGGYGACSLDQCSRSFEQQLQRSSCESAENSLTQCLTTNLRDMSDNCNCDVGKIAGFELLRSPRVNLCEIKRCIAESAFTPCLQLIGGIANGQSSMDELLQCLYNSRAQGENLNCISNVFNYRGSLVQDLIDLLEDIKGGCQTQNVAQCGEAQELVQDAQSNDIAEACENIDLSSLQSCTNSQLPGHLCQDSRRVLGAWINAMESFTHDICDDIERISNSYQASCSGKKYIRDIFSRREAAKKTSFKDLVQMFL